MGSEKSYVAGSFCNPLCNVTQCYRHVVCNYSVVKYKKAKKSVFDLPEDFYKLITNI